MCEAVVVGRKPTFPRRVLSLLHIPGPGIDFGLGFFGCKFVALLGVALDLRVSAFDNIRILSELGPLRLNLSAEFLPFSFDLIPIHDEFPLIRDCQARGVYADNRRADIDVDQRPYLMVTVSKCVPRSLVGAKRTLL